MQSVRNATIRRSSCFHVVRGSNVRATRFFVAAYAHPHLTQRGSSPREVLGVSQEANVKEIKKAFRKLALKSHTFLAEYLVDNVCACRHHPDTEGGSERDFVEVLRAYEILVGKCDGKEGVTSADWDFHDWYWRFTISRSKQNVQENNNGTSRLRANFRSQLAGLKQRAAFRGAKQRARKHASSSSVFSSENVDFDSLSDTADSPSDCGSNSEPMNANERARFEAEVQRRASLNSAQAKQSISHQLDGLKRRAEIRQNL